MVSVKETISVFKRIAASIEENKLFLTELDAKIGDGDHGLNLSKGFNCVLDKLSKEEPKDMGSLMKIVGMTLVSTVGGASGALYGTAFIKASAVVKDKAELSIEDFKDLLSEALKGIKMRGKGELGDKTMIDSLEPALNSLKEDILNNKDYLECLFNAKEASKAAVESTKAIIAKKGRASYLGERSIGHQDPGATSSYLILNAIYEEVKVIKDNKA